MYRVTVIRHAFRFGISRRRSFVQTLRRSCACVYYACVSRVIPSSPGRHSETCARERADRVTGDRNRTGRGQSSDRFSQNACLAVRPTRRRVTREHPLPHPHRRPFTTTCRTPKNRLPIFHGPRDISPGRRALYAVQTRHAYLSYGYDFQRRL